MPDAVAQNVGMAPSLSPAMLEFLRESHFATLTTLRPDGSPHVVAVGFSYDAAAGVARIITMGGSVKARNAARGGRAAVCQVDGPRWVSLEGPVRVVADPDAVASTAAAYATRYGPAEDRPGRVVIEIAVERVLGHV